MEIVILPLAAMFLTSYFYYQHGGVETSILVRCVTSAHGILGILLFISAMTIGFTGNHNESNFKPFLISYLLPVSSILLSFILFHGNKKNSPAANHQYNFSASIIFYRWHVCNRAVAMTSNKSLKSLTSFAGTG